MASNQGPMVHRRRLGAELRLLRDRAGLKIEDVASALECSVSKISRLETGKGIPKPRDVRDMLRMYGVRDDERWDRLVRWAQEGKQRGWWSRYQDVLPGHTDRYIALESDASSLDTFDITVLHGILQTRDYARLVVRASNPSFRDEHVERVVALRSWRQERLTESDNPLAVCAVIDEAALLRPIGGAAVMRDQLDRLLDMADLPTVTLRVLPLVASPHRALRGPFTVLHFTGDDDRAVVHVEGMAGDSFLEGAGGEKHLAIFDDLAGRALDAEGSRALLERRRLDT